MPIEIIRQIQKQKAEEAAKRERVRLEALEKERLAQMEAERQRKAAEEKRRQFIAQQTGKILGQSGALEGLKRIDRELLRGNVSNHSLNYSPENGTVTLAWGNGFQTLSDGRVQGKGQDYNFSSIQITVNPDKEILIIQGLTTYQSNQNNWKDPKTVEKTLALAYLDPKRTIYSPPDRSSNDGEGCCSCSR